MIKFGSMTLRRIPGRTETKKMAKTRYCKAAAELSTLRNCAARHGGVVQLEYPR